MYFPPSIFNLPCVLDLFFLSFVRCTVQFDVLPDGDAFFVLALFLFRPTLKWNSVPYTTPHFFFFFTPIFCVYHLKGCILPAKGLLNKALILRNVWDNGTVTFRVFYAIAECAGK